MTLAELKEEIDRLVEELGGIGHAEIPLYNYSTESWIDDIEIYRHDKNEKQAIPRRYDNARSTI